jgi:hypothetical protein
MEKEKLIKKNVLKWFSEHPDYLKMVEDIYNRRSRLSLRIIDFFVTNYSKRNRVLLPDPDNPHIFSVELYSTYKDTLKCYRKKLFDPFKRIGSTHSKYTEDSDITKLSVRQLNFFKWAIKMRLLDYLIRNKDLVEKDMIKNRKHILKKPNAKKPNVPAIVPCSYTYTQTNTRQ